MRIRTVRHRGLKRFIEDDDDRGIRRDLVNRVRRVLTALLSVENIEGLEGPPGWRIHQLTGDRSGTWSISVSGNWQPTFDRKLARRVPGPVDGWVKPTAVRSSEVGCLKRSRHNPRSPWPGLSRPSTPF